jgi:hypothetical protein
VAGEERDRRLCVLVDPVPVIRDVLEVGPVIIRAADEERLLLLVLPQDAGSTREDEAQEYR